MSTRAHTSQQAAVRAATSGGLRIAAVQMASGPSVAANLAEAEVLIKMAAKQGARLVALPEYFAIMGLKDVDKVAVREREGEGPIQTFLSRLAAKLGIWIIGGSVPLWCDDPAKVKNSTLVFDDQGRLAARYDKIHLFGFEMNGEKYREENTIEAGRDIVVFDSPFGRVGLAICYDLRFPEMFRRMQPVDLIVVPAAFTETTGRAHWETLVRARAIENLAYVVASAQGGFHRNGRETHGDSMIVDPWGIVLDRLPRGSGVVVADIDNDYKARLRQSLPALDHRVLA
ncbi:carbon-nitrogen hydrolase family protein [Chitinimonas koreensis]|uniref:carbon-nitrogen hydrolase family protein n=1 Tax=Chitinimonas koreensis TaxID=356302 RepID=UPI00040E1593|nr:carbon-nitrogen hydrolase family protein [Chitinimonas koreensis]QNM94757.1 carbon-nitrogen hydrolase family protein [Chitinimonas koreensis]